jgi:hypothetical protein
MISGKPTLGWNATPNEDHTANMITAEVNPGSNEGFSRFTAAAPAPPASAIPSTTLLSIPVGGICRIVVWAKSSAGPWFNKQYVVIDWLGNPVLEVVASTPELDAPFISSTGDRAIRVRVDQPLTVWLETNKNSGRIIRGAPVDYYVTSASLLKTDMSTGVETTVLGPIPLANAVAAPAPLNPIYHERICSTVFAANSLSTDASGLEFRGTINGGITIDSLKVYALPLSAFTQTGALSAEVSSSTLIQGHITNAYPSATYKFQYKIGAGAYADIPASSGYDSTIVVGPPVNNTSTTTADIPNAAVILAGLDSLVSEGDVLTFRLLESVGSWAADRELWTSGPHTLMKDVRINGSIITN